MDDKKRLLLALGISGVMLLIYTLFFVPDRPQTPPTPQTQATQTTQVPASTTPGQTTAPAVISGATQAQTQGQTQSQVVGKGEDIVVETPLYHAVFNERGGALRKVTLSRYFNEAEEQGGDFSLLDLNPQGPLSLAFNLPGLDPQLGLKNFQASAKSLKLGTGDTPGSLSFTAVSGGLKIIKTYTFNPEHYGFDLKVEVLNQSNTPFGISPALGMVEEADKKFEQNSYAFTGAQLVKNGSLFEWGYAGSWFNDADLEDNPEVSGKISFASLSIPYFMGAMAPLGENDAPEDVKVIGGKKGALMEVTLEGHQIVVQPNQAASFRYFVFYGPKDRDILEGLGHDLSDAVDFGWFNFLAQPFLTLLKLIYDHAIPNYGIAIIIITILVKILFWPLTAKSYKSMKQMRKLQPHITKIRDKYKGDKTRMNQEVMQLYKTYKVNPMGGCLPMIVQIPVFIAFYKVLGASIELRHAPFMLWINDLSAPDRLNIGFDIPYVGGLPVLTLLMGASMFIQQKMTPTTGDPTQAKMMMMMPIIFTFMFINFPSGLVLYWFVNNLLGIGQQYYTNKRKD